MTLTGAGAKLKAFCKKAYDSVFKRVGHKIVQKKYLYPSFLMPFLIMAAVFAALAIFPFGERSVLILDMNAQYVYFFEQFRDSVLSSDESILYSFERALGGEFLGTYTYYLASPFSYLVVLFPKDRITDAIKLIMLLKCGFAGLSFSYYLDKTRKKNAFGFTAFSTMYALCAYATTFQSNIMWMDALIWLPLITLGIERIIRTGHFKLFIVSLAIGIWSNYYIGYMLCIYVALYFICYMLGHSNKEVNESGENLHALKTLLRMALYSIIAVLIACFVIFGALHSLSFGKSTHQSTEITWDLKIDFLNLITKLFIGSYDTVRPVGTPNIYSGILMLLMLPAYFLTDKIKGREKIAYALLCAVFVASFSINALDLAWHGFQAPIWLSYRYSFIFSFITLVMAYKGFEHYKEMSGKLFFGIGAGLIGLLMIIQKTVTISRYVRSEDQVKQLMPDWQIIWLSIAFILAYLIFIYFSKHTKLIITASVVLLILVGIEGFASAHINWKEQINDVGWASRTEYNNYVKRVQAGMDYISDIEKDAALYRVEKTMFRQNNDALALDMNGISEFNSTFNKDVIEFLKKTGFVSRAQASKYLCGNEAIDSILGIKYVIGYGPTSEGVQLDHVSSLYEKELLKEQNIYVYKNPYALSIAYGVDSNIKNTRLEYDNVYSPFEYTEILAGAMMGLENDEGYKLFNEVDYSILYKNNCTSSRYTEELRFTRTSSATKASFTFNVTTAQEGSVYMYLPSPYTTIASLYVNDTFITKLFNTDYQRMVNLGTYGAGDIINVRVEFEAYQIVIKTTYPLFVQTNEEALKTFTDTCKENQLNVTSFKDTKIEGNLTASKDMTVFTTIPYDSGWKVYVDGKRVETFEVTETMLAFDVSAGEHEIVMKYMPTEVTFGIALSIVGVLLFAFLVFAEWKWKILVPKKVAFAPLDNDLEKTDDCEATAPDESNDENPTI